MHLKLHHFSPLGRSLPPSLVTEDLMSAMMATAALQIGNIIQICLYFLIATGDTWTPDKKGLMTHAFFLSSP
jgi:hypothetical protein